MRMTSEESAYRDEESVDGRKDGLPDLVLMEEISLTGIVENLRLRYVLDVQKSTSTQASTIEDLHAGEFTPT